MPKQYTPEVITYVLDRLGRYKSVYGPCQGLAPKLNIRAETLRRWVVQIQIDVGDRTGPPARNSPRSKRSRPRSRIWKKPMKSSGSQRFSSRESSTLAGANHRIH
ncbi:hypothetical protein [Glutamicibacter sp. NPDC087583]|uniref:hypothetical protein n=1 Tax=Glutamicibacter sp. NPDC087583 TaxID=3363995 RepID=UPI003809E590